MDGGILWFVIFLPLPPLWLALVALEVRQILKLRGRRCKERDALEAALGAQIFFALGIVFFAVVDAPFLTGACMVAEFAATLLGLFFFAKLRDAASNHL